LLPGARHSSVAAVKRPPALLPLLGVVAAAVSLGLGFGFMVDDALITTRVGQQLALHGAYRFNPVGARVDCVTPIGFAWLVALWAKAGPWSGFLASRLVGAGCHLATGLVLGVLMHEAAAQDRQSLRRKALLAVAALLPLSFNLPFGAWGSSGMETPWITLFCTCALLPNRYFAVWIALATAWRPELIPWGIILAVLRADTARGRAIAVAVALSGPALAVAARLAFFGHPAPLAIFAKPSDVQHGLGYVLGAARLLGVPLLLVGWAAWKRQSRPTYAVAAASLVHAVAVSAAGGDWMPYFRLFIPTLPGLVWVGFHLMLHSSLPSILARSLAASALSLLLATSSGQAARGIVQARAALIESAREPLRGAWNIASLDVGWVGAASAAPITDLAGVTDPEIAHLPGGHTSKRIPNNLLDQRSVNKLVLLLAPGVGAIELERTRWQELRFARVVEQRVARLGGAEEFVPTQLLPLPGTNQHYLVLTRLTQRLATVPVHP
jgi:hypothetical protein